MHIEKITEYSKLLLGAIQTLLPQLTDKKKSFSRGDLEKLLASENTHLFAALNKDDRISGILTLNIYRIPTGLKARIDDVVVDEAVRGAGIGEKLMYKALEFCRKMEVNEIGLTSHPSRESANRLYKRLGFEQHETNVYRYPLTQSK